MLVRVVVLLGFCLLTAPLARAGDEGMRPKAKKIDIKEEATPPAAVEEPVQVNPEPAVGEAPVEEQAPVARPRTRRVVRQSVMPVPKPAPKWRNTDPDENMDYSRIEGMVRKGGLPEGVLPPALGARGYRSTVFALGAGDRTPGLGLFLEHSFDRLGFGIAASYLPLYQDTRAQSYAFYNLYSFYRWLPYSMSPYLHAGVEYGMGTPEQVGLIGGVGIDMKLVVGITFYVGYTFHSVAQKGYAGGALGWAF
jgi:hypothetical protein